MRISLVIDFKMWCHSDDYDDCDDEIMLNRHYCRCVRFGTAYDGFDSVPQIAKIRMTHSH